MYTYVKWRLRRRGVRTRRGEGAGEGKEREGSLAEGGKGFGGAYTTHWGKGVNFDRRAHG